MDKQPSSRYCFLCGRENPIGLKLVFFDDGEDRVVADFIPREEHQGYPGTLHGGITCALLDETIGRTLVPYDIWAMTAELNVRFRKQIPLGQPLQVVGELVRLRSRTMEGRGEIRLADGSVGATAEAKYILLPDEEVEAFKEELDYWRVVPEERDESS
ncbi:MAG: PaaI family thioesterase [Anaerolineales bacterium]